MGDSEIVEKLELYTAQPMHRPIAARTDETITTIVKRPVPANIARKETKTTGVSCPECKSRNTVVTDSRATGDAVRRRRGCMDCDTRFTTYERHAGIDETKLQRMEAQLRLMQAQMEAMSVTIKEALK